MTPLWEIEQGGKIFFTSLERRKKSSASFWASLARPILSFSSIVEAEDFWLVNDELADLSDLSAELTGFEIFRSKFDNWLMMKSNF